jgi:phage shock protein E
MRAVFHTKFLPYLFSLFLSLLVSPALLAADPIWIDVRTAEEYNSGHVPVAVNIPYTEIAEGISSLTMDKNAAIYVYCRSGRRSGIAQETLQGLGFTQAVNAGGLTDAIQIYSRESVPAPVE